MKFADVVNLLSPAASNRIANFDHESSRQVFVFIGFVNIHVINPVFSQPQIVPMELISANGVTS